MDFIFRCNSLNCRAQLSDRAVVTTCSHIFCTPCVEQLGLWSPHPHAQHRQDDNVRVCPACSTRLANLDDVVIAQLNPTEDYKTSVLSGLSPGVIVECAGRGMAFYTYQATQEIVYQEYLSRSLKEKYNLLSGQMDKVIHEANGEITTLREKMSAMHMERQELEWRYVKLEQDLKQKHKAGSQLQRQYDILKRRQLTGDLELAAQYDASRVVSHQVSAGQMGRHATMASMQQHGGNGTGNGQFSGWMPNVAGVHITNPNNRGTAVTMTPSTHRVQLPRSGPRSHNTAFVNNSSLLPHGQHHGTPARVPLAGIDHNVGRSGLSSGSGMSAGIKVGRQQQSAHVARGGYDRNDTQGMAGVLRL